MDLKSTFPEIKNIRIDVQAENAGSKRLSEAEKEFYHSVYGIDTVPRIHACPSSYCKNGGFNIEMLLLPLVQKRETHWEKGVVLCTGNEGKLAPGYYKRCASYWKVMVDIEYEPTGTTPKLSSPR